jgi:four helix bundle protein
MSGAQTYRDLQVWQKGMDLGEACYRLTALLSKEEDYSLASQTRRAAMSIPSNIAEGFGREQTGSFVQHLRISHGSLKELETQILICSRVGHMSPTQTDGVLAQADELGRMIRALIRSKQS